MIGSRIATSDWGANLRTEAPCARPTAGMLSAVALRPPEIRAGSSQPFPFVC